MSSLSATQVPLKLINTPRSATWPGFLPRTAMRADRWEPGFVLVLPPELGGDERDAWRERALFDVEAHQALREGLPA